MDHHVDTEGREARARAHNGHHDGHFEHDFEPGIY
jgi:hypothetical protein